VKPLSTLGYYQLAFMSKPATDRTVYQLIKKNNFQSFVEIGLGTGHRCQQILRVAGKFSDKPIRYTGIDQFDARPANPSVERIANSHLRTDMIVISPSTQRNELENVISFFPRMLHANSLVLIQFEPDQKMKQLTRLDIERWVKKVETSQKATQTMRKAA